MSEYSVKLDVGVVPTKDTKIILGGSVRVPPIGKNLYYNSIIMNKNKAKAYICFQISFTAIGCWQWGDTTSMLFLLFRLHLVLNN